MTIVEFLLARLDEDEQITRYAGCEQSWTLGECVAADGTGATEWEIAQDGFTHVLACAGTCARTTLHVMTQPAFCARSRPSGRSSPNASASCRTRTQTRPVTEQWSPRCAESSGSSPCHTPTARTSTRAGSFLTREVALRVAVVILGVEARRTGEKHHQTVRWHLLDLLPDAMMMDVDSGHRPFSRAASRNVGVKYAQEAGFDAVVLNDADTLPEREPLLAAIESAHENLPR